MQDSTAVQEKEFVSPSEQHYLKQILDNFPDGVFTINPELIIQYVNPAFCKLLGYDEAELIGGSITEHLGDLDILEACAAEVAEKGYCNDQETIFIRKDGSKVHISKNVQMILDDQGNFKENLVSIRDMTNLHRLNKELEISATELENYASKLEATLKEMQEMQRQLVEAEKMASLGSLVAGIAHEVNTPLGVSVTSATSMHEELESLEQDFRKGSLKRSQLDSFFEQAGQACSILHQNLKRASELVNTFKQVAVDQTIDEVRTINLDDYCHEVLTSLGPKLKHCPVRVSADCDPAINLDTHPGAVYQVVSNLIMNSLIHGYNENEAGQISIAARQDGGNIVIDYRDDGKGIDEANLGRIFEPFFTTRRGQGGSGLGLSIVYNIVTGTLGGAIKADSTPGKGVHFQMTIPSA